MSKRKKLLQRIQQNPKNVSFDDLRMLMEMYGFELRRTRGSHHSFIGYISGQKTLFVVPYKHPLQTVYVKKGLALIEKIDAEKPADEDGDDD